MKSFLKLVLFALFLGVILSFSNDKIESSVKKAINENYSFIPSGILIKQNDTISIQSFIMYKTEVSNYSYQAFLNALKKEGRSNELKIAQIDSSLWVTPQSFGEKYKEYYHNHIAYRDFPVVNISKEGAQLYCEWLTKQINQNLGNESKLQFRLPTENEWEYAANGGKINPVYSWGSNELTTSKGSVCCNFLRLGANSIGRDSLGKYKVHPVISIKDEFSDILAPVKSYWPNNYDLYNMCGNVAELLADKTEVAGGSWNDPGYDVRIVSRKPYQGAARNIGFRVVATIIPTEHPWLNIPKHK